MEKEVIRLEHLWFSYGAELVLEDVNLSLKPLEFLSVIGPNGGGKTTLLKLLLGLIKPTTGEIQVLGTTPDHSRRQVGYVPQSATIDERFPTTVWEVTLMGRLGRIPLGKKYRTEDRELAAEALYKVNMYEMRNRQIGKLSGGQQQRTFIARALVTQPQILLLDEPTASVDSRIKQDLYELLGALNEQMTIIMVSHDIGVVSQYAKTIACLNRRLVYHDEKGITPEMLAETYQCPVDLIAHGVPHRVLAPHSH
jgi:zinc transport system ATP-binding protein